MRAREILIVVALAAVIGAGAGCAPAAEEPSRPAEVTATPVPASPTATRRATPGPAELPMTSEENESPPATAPTIGPREVATLVIHTPLPSIPGLVPPAAGRDVVERARDDLAQRLKVELEEVEVVTVVTDEYAWDDLLCPSGKEPGRPIPAFVVGQEIVLSAGGAEYLYRAQGSALVFCGER
jgi:hypothetical protein